MFHCSLKDISCTVNVAVFPPPPPPLNPFSVGEMCYRSLYSTLTTDNSSGSAYIYIYIYIYIYLFRVLLNCMCLCMTTNAATICNGQLVCVYYIYVKMCLFIHHLCVTAVGSNLFVYDSDGVCNQYLATAISLYLLLHAYNIPCTCNFVNISSCFWTIPSEVPTMRSDCLCVNNVRKFLLYFVCVLMPRSLLLYFRQVCVWMPRSLLLYFRQVCVWMPRSLLLYFRQVCVWMPRSLLYFRQVCVWMPRWLLYFNQACVLMPHWLLLYSRQVCVLMPHWLLLYSGQVCVLMPRWLVVL